MSRPRDVVGRRPYTGARCFVVRLGVSDVVLYGLLIGADSGANTSNGGAASVRPRPGRTKELHEVLRSGGSRAGDPGRVVSFTEAQGRCFVYGLRA